MTTTVFHSIPMLYYTCTILEYNYSSLDIATTRIFRRIRNIYTQIIDGRQYMFILISSACVCLTFEGQTAYIPLCVNRKRTFSVPFRPLFGKDEGRRGGRGGPFSLHRKRAIINGPAEPLPRGGGSPAS